MALLGARDKPAPVLSDEATRDEVAEAITYTNTAAKRAQHIVGTDEYPTRWDRDHRALNRWLDVWESMG